MKDFLLLARATARNAARWATEHIYVLVILAPIVVGVTIWSVARLAAGAPAWPVSFRFQIVLALLVEISLILYGMSRAVAEIYHVRRPESLFDPLPVEAGVHLHVALVNRIVRTALVGAAAVTLARVVFSSASHVNLTLLVSVAFFVLLTALAQMFAALIWIHQSAAKRSGGMLAVLTAMTLLALPGAALAALLLLKIFTPLAAVAGTNLFSSWLLLLASLFWACALYLGVRFAHGRWRVSDIEHAQRLQTRTSAMRLQLRFTDKLFKQRIGVQIARDLRLTLRTFSSIVYVVTSLAVLWIIALVVALTTNVLPVVPTVSDVPAWVAIGWLPPIIAAKFACVLACVTLIVLLPAIINYELPHLWLERATGTRGEEMWDAKLWYARLVTLPAPLAAWSASVASGTVALIHAPILLLECLWVWWLVSTLAATLAFEIPDRFGLAVILITTLCLSAGLFVALFWPMGLIILVFGVPQLTARGRARARYFLVAEES